MPIRPENVERYPKNWLTEIRPSILERARHRCENCGVPNYAFGYRDSAGNWNRCARDNELVSIPLLSESAVRELGFKPFKVVLTVAHLDHTPENCDPENLRAWCQYCHLRYDHRHHAETAYKTKREGRAVGDMFELGEG